MIVGRREFLRMLGISAGAAGWASCRGGWRVPDHLVQRALAGPGLESWKQSVCGLCESGCGLSVRLVDGIPVGVKGNPRHPLNRGGLCPVGQAALEFLYAPSRPTGPLHRSADGSYEPIVFDRALAEVGDRLAGIVGKREERIAIVSGEPGEPFDDLLERCAGAFGTTRVFRLGRPDTVPYYLSQGLDRVPGFDLTHSDLVFSFGLDLLAEGTSPLHAVSALVGRRATEDRATLLHVGSRLSPGTARADQRAVVRPGTHGAFALGVANVLVREGRYDRDFVAERTFGFDDWTDEDGERRLGFRRLLLERYYPDRAAQLCGASPTQIIDMARRFGDARTPLAVAGGEATSGTNATWTAMAVHALNALAGSFGREGGVLPPPSIPLTRLDPLPEPEASAAVADATAPFGSDPVTTLAEAIEDGRVEAVLLLSANPVYDHPAGERLRRALETAPLTVAVAPFLDETAAACEYVLPGPIFLERWQAISTPPGTAFGTLGLAAPVVEPLHDSRHPGDLLLSLAAALGSGDTLPWASYEEYLRGRVEGISISGAGAPISGSFEESWVRFLEERGWRFQDPRAGGDPWREIVERAGWWNPARSLDDWAQLFPASGRFEFFSRALDRRLRELASANGDSFADRREAAHRGATRLGLDAVDDEACMPHFESPRTAGAGELVLVPYRPLTARGPIAAASPMVAEMFAYPVLSGWETSVEIGPQTAHDLDLHDGDRVVVESDRDAFPAVVRVQLGAAADTALVPVGLGRDERVGGSDVGANPLRAVLPAADVLAGIAAAAATKVRLRLVRRRPHGGPAPLHGGEA